MLFQCSTVFTLQPIKVSLYSRLTNLLERQQMGIPAKELRSRTQLLRGLGIELHADRNAG